MKDTYVDGEKLARNGRKTATYYAASFLPHYRRVLFSHLLCLVLLCDQNSFGHIEGQGSFHEFSGFLPIFLSRKRFMKTCCELDDVLQFNASLT